MTLQCFLHLESDESVLKGYDEHLTWPPGVQSNMERSSAAALAAAAAASVAAFLVLRRKSKPCKDAQGRTRKDAPVLCFGDSLTEGYHGVWIHPTYSPPSNPNDPAKETEAMKLHPYALRLGDRLADQAGDDTPQRRARYACCRAWKPGQKPTHRADFNARICKRPLPRKHRLQRAHMQSGQKPTRAYATGLEIPREHSRAGGTAGRRRISSRCSRGSCARAPGAAR